jgi:hypothetical protein
VSNKNQICLLFDHVSEEVDKYESLGFGMTRHASVVLASQVVAPKNLDSFPFLKWATNQKMKNSEILKTSY